MKPVYYDYNKMFDRTLDITNNTDLFINSNYCGFVKAESIEENLNTYHELAVEISKDLSWDYVVLYAIIEYGKGQTIISANFMNLEIPYGVYKQIVKKLYEHCRLFFIRGKKECYNE